MRFCKERHAWLWIAALAVAGGGCKVGPDYAPPKVSMPAAYHEQFAGAATNSTPETLSRWWQVFHDDELDQLVRTATLANNDVRLARARVREAQALRGVSRSTLFPSLDAGGQYTRRRLSQNTPAGTLAKAAHESNEQNDYNAGLDMSWELDVFGGRRRSVEAAGAEMEAAQEAERSIQVVVLGEVGLNYLELRGLQKQLEVARSNLQLQEQTLALTRDRFRAGLASDLDTARAEAQAASTRAGIPLLEQQAARTIHNLGVLIGKGPTELEQALTPAKPIPSAPPRIPVGLPSELLRQRPDLRQAERELAAATAQVGAATADLFPRFFLTGAAGVESVKASDFFDGASRFWSLGPTMRWPVFTAGRIRQNIKATSARQEQALVRYEQAVLVSLGEVEDALVACGKEQEHYDALTQSEAADRRAVDLADERYRSGLVDFLNVLETQRSLLAVQDELARSEQALGQNTVRLYKALGGGWDTDKQFAARDAAMR